MGFLGGDKSPYLSCIGYGGASAISPEQSSMGGGESEQGGALSTSECLSGGECGDSGTEHKVKRHPGLLLLISDPGSMEVAFTIQE